MEQTTFTQRNNAKRAAERMIDKGSAPSIDYKLHEREDGRIEIIWKAAEPAATEQIEEELTEVTGEADKPEAAASNTVPGAEEVAKCYETEESPEDNGFGPDPWPPGARVRVALSKRRMRLGTVDYQVDQQYWRVFLDDSPKVSNLYRGNQLSAPGDDAPVPRPAKKERALRTGPKRTSKSAELDTAAAQGVMPEKPICTSEANKDQYQKRFDFLAERAAAGDWDAVRNYEVKGVNSYAKMVKLYRERLLTAHEAQQAMEAA
jgi:hypothetical protein